MKSLRSICAGRCLTIGVPLLLLTFGFSAGVAAQTVTSLSQVKTLYVDKFGGGSDGAMLRDGLIRKLAKDRRFVLTRSAQGADAVLTGSGEIWIRGYVSINPRTPSSDRQAVYGGYLSLEVVSGSGEPLWSWLQTPTRVSWTSIVDDISGGAAKKLTEATKAGVVMVSASAPGARSHPQTTLTGAGATFPAPLYRKWFQDFEQSEPGTYVQYSPVGSQNGIESLVARKVDFAGSDVVPNLVVEAERAANLRRFATVLGGIVPIYNIKGGTQDLHFTPEALADIYLGKVRRWNDPEIRQANRGVNLPDDEIAVVHRSDGSGSTWVWTDFLSKWSHEWATNLGRGTTLHWPVGKGAEGNGGVADAVHSTPNSIGYVELAYAIQHDMSFGAVRNRAGEFIHADLDSLAAATTVSGVASEPPQSITDAPGKYAYPIAAYTWIVVPANIEDPLKKAAIAELLRWMLTSGQKECSALGYTPLPRDVAEAQLRVLNGQ